MQAATTNQFWVDPAIPGMKPLGCPSVGLFCESKHHFAHVIFTLLVCVTKKKKKKAVEAQEQGYCPSANDFNWQLNL